MIHPSSKLHVWVEVSDDDGDTWTALEEYKTETGPDYVTNHIESKTGQRFRIQAEKLKDSALHDDLAFELFYDGYNAGCLCQRHHNYDSAIFFGIKTSSTVLQPFIFSSLQTTHDSSSNPEDNACERIGKIEVQVWRARLSEYIEDAQDTYPELPKSEVFLEQTVKAKKLDHQVAFGTEEHVAPDRWFAIERLGSSPIATFTFYYLSEALLDLKGIRPFPRTAPVSSAFDSKRSAEEGSYSKYWKTRVVDIDDSDEEEEVKVEEGVGTKKRRGDRSATIGAEDAKMDVQAELKKLREEVNRLKKKAKVEEEDIVDLTKD